MFVIESYEAALGYIEASSHPGVSLALCVGQHGSPHPVPRQSESSEPKGTFLRDAEEEEESICSQACIQTPQGLVLQGAPSGRSSCVP